MPWVRLDEQFPDHPKVQVVGPLASWLHVCALAYCNRLLTDGFVPNNKVGTLADFSEVWDDPAGAGEFAVNPYRLADKLCEARMWEQVPGGYRIHDYHEYQPTKADVLAERKAKAEAGRRGGLASAAARRGNASSQVRGSVEAEPQAPAQAPASRPVAEPFQAERQADAKQNPSPTRPVTDTDLQSQNLCAVPARISEAPPGFDAFWEVYPRKEGKLAAQKAWPKAYKAAGGSAIVEGARRFAEDPNRDPTYTPHPSAWLNAGRWSDEPLPPRNGNGRRPVSRLDESLARIRAEEAG